VIAPRDKPPVSVLLPVRNGQAYLAAAIASVLAQDHADFELLVVDDGSTDATPAILAEAAAADPRLRILRGGDGLVAALNSGLDAATAPWIARMDADDLAHPQRLRMQLRAAHDAPETVVFGSAYRMIDSVGRPLRVVHEPLTPAAIAEELPRRNCLAHPTVLLRRDAVLAIGGYRPAFPQAEDYDLWLRLAEHHPLSNLPEVLLDYRQHAGQSAWSAVEQRLRSEYGAQVAAASRRAGDLDFGGAAAPVDAAALLAAGISPRQLARRMTSAALGAAIDARRAGQGGATVAAARVVMKQPGLRWRTRVHASLLTALGFVMALVERLSRWRGRRRTVGPPLPATAWGESRPARDPPIPGAPMDR